VGPAAELAGGRAAVLGRPLRANRRTAVARAFGERVRSLRIAADLSEGELAARCGVPRSTATISPRGNVAGGKPAEFTTKIERDAQGRPLTVTDLLKHTTNYTYDGDGNVETVTDGNSNKTKYTYNADNATDESVRGLQRGDLRSDRCVSPRS
jgi:YD repeat-containing protein